MRIVVPVVIDMTDEQVKVYADEYGLDVRGDGMPAAKDMVADVRSTVLTAIQGSPAFYESGASVTLKER